MNKKGELKHYGVPGMRWGVRRARHPAGNQFHTSISDRSNRLNKYMELRSIIDLKRKSLESRDAFDYELSLANTQKKYNDALASKFSEIDKTSKSKIVRFGKKFISAYEHANEPQWMQEIQSTVDKYYGKDNARRERVINARKKTLHEYRTELDRVYKERAEGKNFFEKLAISAATNKELNRKYEIKLLEDELAALED